MTTYARALDRARLNVERAHTVLTEAERARDELIVEAAEAGVPYRTLANLAGISHGRVGQIVDRARS